MSYLTNKPAHLDLFLAIGTCYDESISRAESLKGGEPAVQMNSGIESIEEKFRILILDDFLVYTQQNGFARWRTTPHKYGKEGVEANKRGDMNPPQGSFFYGMYKGDLDAGVNTVSNLSGLIKSIDPCADIVNELAAPFAE